MSRTVTCRKYKKELKGLDLVPMPGAIGQDIYEHVSEQAWKEWQTQQTMLINEKQLNMMDSANRAFLREQMEKFFQNEEYEHAEGYVPTSKPKE
ncbi:MAG: Fe-S cluster biosynthesis and repair protein YggX [Oleiphilaceae bacterium]|jgi:Fe-S cluster biosynthesis and repair protein YggX